MLAAYRYEVSDDKERYDDGDGAHGNGRAGRIPWERNRLQTGLWRRGLIIRVA